MYSSHGCKTRLPHMRSSVNPAVQVRGLEFNGLSPNLLASGGSDGELCIWDVAVPSAPNLYPGLKARALVLYDRGLRAYPNPLLRCALLKCKHSRTHCRLVAPRMYAST